MALLAARADHVSRCPTRAFVKPTAPGKPTSQGVKTSPSHLGWSPRPTVAAHWVRSRRGLAGQPGRVLHHRAVPDRGRRQLHRRATRHTTVTSSRPRALAMPPRTRPGWSCRPRRAAHWPGTGGPCPGACAKTIAPATGPARGAAETGEGAHLKRAETSHVT